MVRLQKVNFHVNSIYDLDLDFLVNLERKVVLIDLDNTLAPYFVTVPSAQTHALINEMKEKGLIPVIISNNRAKRVRPFCQSLGVNYLSSTHKPSTKRITKYLIARGIEPSKTILIGDQLLTDIKMGRKLKAITILTEPITKKDQWTTRINRLIDRPLRKSYRKKNMLGRQATSRQHREV